MTAKEMKESFKELQDSIRETANEIQHLAVFALDQARKGELEYANQLVYTLNQMKLYEPNFLIEWFEVFGRLRWSNKKGRFVNSNRGRWQIDQAQSKHWAEIPIGKLSKGTLRKEVRQNLPVERMSESQFREAIRAYNDVFPTEESSIGKLGVPADKNRWGKYKLKIKRK